MGGWGEAKTRVGLLLAPDLRSIAKKLREAEVELADAVTLIGVARENVATAKGPGEYLEAAHFLAKDGHGLVLEALQAITGRKP